MCNKVMFTFSSVITFITCEPFNGIVYNHVFDQVASTREFLVTYLTNEWSLPRVFSCMNNQLSIRYPPPITRITFEGSIIRVRLQVFNKTAT